MMKRDKRSLRTVTRSQAPISSYYTTIKSFINWCDNCNYLVKNPIKNIKPPKIGKRSPKAMTLDAYQLLLLEASKTNDPVRDTLLLKFGFTMGLRLSEISGISLNDFSPSINKPETLLVLGKGEKERVIPIPDSVKISIKSYIERREVILGGEFEPRLLLSSRVSSGSRALSRDGIGQVFDKLITRAGVKQSGLRDHMASHSFATHLLNSESSDLLGVKELLGHSSVATTQIYLTVDSKKLFKSVNDNPLNKL